MRSLLVGSVFALLACRPYPGPLGGAPYPLRAEPPRPQPTPEHVVQPGETLTRIARRYGVSVRALIERNRIPDPDRIRVGQRLLLPGVDAGAARPGAPALPPELEAALERADRFLREARFAEALRAVDRARELVVAGAQGDPARIRVEEITAYIHAARGERSAAVRAYGRLLEIEPDYEPPGSTPPKVRSAFEAAAGRGSPPTDVP